MEINEINQILELKERPAFGVIDGIIAAANRAALAKYIPLNTNVDSMLASGREEYRDLSVGRLYLSLAIHGTIFGATVTKMNGWDLFLLDSEFIGNDLQILALAAREIRAPLNRILATTESLFPKIADGSTQEEMACINRALYQLQRLVSNMSDAGARSMARLELQDVTAVAQELFDQAQELCAAAGVTLEFTNLPVSAISLIDRDRLERGIYNILSNSLKYAGQSRIIRASLTQRRNNLCFTISDCGSGPTHDPSADLFRQYLREPGIEDGCHGIGLGLTLVRSAALAHGGTVLMDTTGDGGAKTVLSLPIRQNSVVQTSPLRIDYTGERNHGLIELADSLPSELYAPDKL